MAKEDKNDNKKKKDGGKKGLSGCLFGIMAIVLVIVLLASFVFAIFDAIVEFIKNVVLGVINGVINFLAHPIKSTIQALGGLGNWLSAMINQDFSGWAGEITQPKQLIEVSQDEFIVMRDAIDESISRNAAGLDDIMLKKMLLAYNTGKYSRNADIIIELTKDEADALKKDETQPFSVKQGKDLEQLDLNALDVAANRVGTFFDTLFSGGNIFSSEVYRDARDEREAKQNKYYLHAKGVLKFVNEKNEELIYFDEESLEKLFKDEFEAKRYGAQSDYAQSVWEYLSTKCYTDGEKGMKMYAHETVEEELVDWYFEDNDPNIDSFGEIFDLGDQLLSGVAINRKMISDEYLSFSDGWLSGGLLDIAKKNYEIQDLDYYSLVSQYTTPVEFMIDLLNISSSKEFVNAFIDKMTNETEVTLKIYRVGKSSSEEITEITNERTEVLAKADIKVEITHYDDDNDFMNKEWSAGTGGVTVKEVIIEDGKVFFDLIDSIKLTIKLGNVTEDVAGVKGTITFAETGTTATFEVPGTVGDDIAGIFFNPFYDNAETENGDRVYTFTKQLDWGTTAYKTRDNTATIKQYTTKVTTDTQLDIAVEKAKTWYGIFEYNNKIQPDGIFETLENESDTVRVPANRNDIIDEKTGKIKDTLWEPIMISKTKETQTATKDSSNKNTIFAEHSIEEYAWSEIGSRIERWYAELNADNVVYWITAGPLTHSLYTELDKDKGYQLLKDPDELLNIRLTYAMENGPADWWINRYYVPVEMSQEVIAVTDENHEYYEALKDTGYAIGYLYQTIDRHLVPGTAEVKENTDFFLSLLKNNTGEYSTDASYNPNGIEVVYKTVYDSEDRVARFFETSAEMLFDLLESSPHTQGLADIMRYTLYQYSTKDYGVTEFNYEIINREGFEYI